jgi:predicted ArsR family transcriptional regulator
MSLLWIRPLFAERHYLPDERRVRDFLESPAGVSESVASLSHKLGIQSGRLRRILDQLVEEGLVQRQDFADIEPIYFRFPPR